MGGHQREELKVRIARHPPSYGVDFLFCAVKSTRGHNAAEYSGTVGAADEQTELQRGEDICDDEQETG